MDTAVTPSISIVMPLYRSDKHLRESIDSIIRQTFRDYELIVMVDNASEETVSILNEYAKSDGRLRIFFHDDLGLVKSLNAGIEEAKGRYVARMDCDDICMPVRLEKQFDYMEEHPEIGILGTAYEIIDDRGDMTYVGHPIRNPKLIKWRLIYDNCLTHSSVMFRKSALKKTGYYRAEARHAEDYDLWVRASGLVNIANHPEVLMKYRVHGGSVSVNHSGAQDKVVRDIVHRRVNDLLGHPVSPEEIADLREFVRGNPVNDVRRINRSIDLLDDLCVRFVAGNRLTAAETGMITNDVVIKTLKMTVKEKRVPVSARIKMAFRAALIKIRSYRRILRRQNAAQ